MLLASGEIEVEPLEDAKAFEVANPLQPDGTLVFDAALQIDREQAMARRVLGKGDPESILVLRSLHDLDLRRVNGRCVYERVE